MSIIGKIGKYVTSKADSDDGTIMAPLTLLFICVNSIVVASYSYYNYLPKWEIVASLVLMEALFLQYALDSRKKLTFWKVLGVKLGSFVLGWSVALPSSGIYYGIRKLGLERIISFFQGVGMVIGVVAVVAGFIGLNLIIGRAIQRRSSK